MTTPPELLRPVPLGYPAAIQAVAALEDRLREYQAHVRAGAPVEFVIVDCHAALVAIRTAFRIPRELTDLERKALFDAVEVERERGGLDVPKAAAVADLMDWADNNIPTAWSEAEKREAWGK